jgi:hypothetical protein
MSPIGQALSARLLARWRRVASLAARLCAVAPRVAFSRKEGPAAQAVSRDHRTFQTPLVTLQGSRNGAMSAEMRASVHASAGQSNVGNPAEAQDEMRHPIRLRSATVPGLSWRRGWNQTSTGIANGD